MKERSNVESVTGIGIVEIGEAAFKYSRGIKEVSFPKLKKIGRNAFERCENLKSITAPLVEEIGAGGFKTCKSLTEVNFPHLKVVEQDVFNAFNGKLEKIVLSGATELKDNAFGYQPNIKSVEFGSVPPTLSSQAFSNEMKSKNPKLIVPANAVSAYGTVGTKWKGIFTIEAKQ